MDRPYRQPYGGPPASQPILDPRTYSTSSNNHRPTPTNQDYNAASFHENPGSNPYAELHNVTPHSSQSQMQGPYPPFHQNLNPYFPHTEDHNNYRPQQYHTLSNPFQPDMASNSLAAADNTQPTASASTAAMASDAPAAQGSTDSASTANAAPKPTASYTRRAVACKSCRAMKCRCDVEPGNTDCNRCIKDGKRCEMVRATATSKTEQRLIDLEAQVGDLEGQVGELEDKVIELEEHMIETDAKFAEMQQQLQALTEERA